LKYSLPFSFSYFQPVAQQHESRTIEKHLSGHYEKYR